MTGMESRPINARYVRRQPTEPGRKLDGMTWINPEGGQSGNNSERAVWNGDAGQWELLLSVGPDTPLHAVEGSRWSDTGNGESKRYTGAAWEGIGVSDHANLSNVKRQQHRTDKQVRGQALAYDFITK